MSVSPLPHLVERAFEQMTRAGTTAIPVAPPALSPFTAASPIDIAAADTPPEAAAGKAAATFAPDAAPDVALPTLQAAGLVVAGARRSRVCEEWAVSAANILRSQRNPPGAPAARGAANLLLVTSARPGEGKSFSALNLAARLALGRMTEVVLVDADGKPGALSSGLGLGESAGLFDLALDHTLRPEDLARTTAIPGLCILPSGRGSETGSAQRAVTSPVMTALETVARRFAGRLVILDSAPCLITSDASMLAGAVGQIVLVVEAGSTQRADVEAALDLLRPCGNITLILNKVRAVSNHAFGKHAYFDG